ncbi:MAG: kelch repeat-containing protein, partial [Planctomycetales bacterium]
MKLRGQAKNISARARSIYFKGLPAVEESKRLAEEIAAPASRLAKEIASLEKDLIALEANLSADSSDSSDAHARKQVQYALRRLRIARNLLSSLGDSLAASVLQDLHRSQIQLEFAAESFDAEPPPRAMNCGSARLSQGKTGPEGVNLVYDSKTKLHVLFGGDHLDYLTNDVWVFDLAKRKWFQRHPKESPPPRANHRLQATGDGTIRMTGGYAYSSNTDYVGGQYIDLDDGTWIYDLDKNTWTGGELTTTNARVYRAGPFHPDFYATPTKPNAAEFEAWLNKIPVNEWVPTNPPRLPRLNRDWGTARIDPDRDMMLRWSGGHSAHGGTDVLHFHFSTNRWELPFPVEFPLGQLYSNTSYPNGFNFNLRPWITGHTYQNYAYDPPSKKMVMAGRPRHFYIYDPDLADWVG